MASDIKELVPYFVGAALAGAGARLGIDVLKNINFLSNPFKIDKSKDIFHSEIPIPIYLTQEQYDELSSKYPEYFSTLKNTKSTAKGDSADQDAKSSKKASLVKEAFLPLDVGLSGLLGGIIGFRATDSILDALSEGNTDEKILQLQRRIAQLALPPDDPDYVYRQLLTRAKSPVVKSEKSGSWLKQASRSARIGKNLKTLRTMASQSKNFLRGLTPAEIGVLAGGGLLAATPLIPFANDTAGDIFLDTVGLPLSGIAGAVSPLLVAGLLYGASRGFSTAEKSDEAAAKVKSLRSSIRQLEMSEPPYFALKPVVLPSSENANVKSSSEKKKLSQEKKASLEALTQLLQRAAMSRASRAGIGSSGPSLANRFRSFFGITPHVTTHEALQPQNFFRLTQNQQQMYLNKALSEIQQRRHQLSKAMTDPFVSSLYDRNVLKNIPSISRLRLQNQISGLRDLRAQPFFQDLFQSAQQLQRYYRPIMAEYRQTRPLAFRPRGSPLVSPRRPQENVMPAVDYNQAAIPTATRILSRLQDLIPPISLRPAYGF